MRMLYFFLFVMNLMIAVTRIPFDSIGMFAGILSFFFLYLFIIYEEPEEEDDG